MRPPAAISFDFWNTLVPEPKGMLSALRREAVLRTLLEHEIELEDGVLDAHLAAAQALHEAHWTRQEHFTAVDAAQHFVNAVDGLDDAVRSRLADTYLNAGEEQALELTPNAADAVAALDRAGIQLGIVCDVGLTASPHLRSFLRLAGVLDRFRGWAFSDEVGHFKPSPAIFSHLGDQFEIAAGDPVWHVGDLRRTDVAGARACGWVPVRYRGMADDVSDFPDADIVIDDLLELVQLARAGR
ncbi:MAG: HAD family hydrolase [Solirubrobacterales bacterium]